MSEGRQPQAASAAADLRGEPSWGLVIAVIWFGGEIAQFLVLDVLRTAGWFDWFYGAKPDSDLRAMIWVACLALPLRLAIALYLVRTLGKLGPADLGLTTHRLARNLLLGLVGTLLLAPLVYAIQLPAEWLFRELSGAPVEEHQVTILARHGLLPAEWVLLVAAVLLAAPLWEELFFRGLVQPWVLAYPPGGPILMGLTVALGVAWRWDHVRPALEASNPRAILIELAPALTALALVPVYLFLRHRIRSPVAAGIFASAVLFGWFHARVWPSPLALTVLAIGLGILARRSRSLVGPIALHAAFNGVACLVLVRETLVR